MRHFPNPSDKLHNNKVAYFEIEYEEVFNLKQLYKLIFEWTSQWGFSPIKNVGQPESLYMELVSGSGGKFHYIWWRFERNDSQYHKVFLKIDYQTLNINTVEVMHQGKKIKTNKGDVILRVETWLMLDYREQWKNHWLLKHFDQWFIKRWYKNNIEKIKKQLWFMTYELEDTIKQYLELKTHYDRPEMFHPEKGLPK